MESITLHNDVLVTKYLGRGRRDTCRVWRREVLANIR